MNSLYMVEGVIGAVGGAIFVQTNKYLQAGMENEDFYGWGLRTEKDITVGWVWLPDLSEWGLFIPFVSSPGSKQDVKIKLLGLKFIGLQT